MSDALREVEWLDHVLLQRRPDGSGWSAQAQRIVETFKGDVSRGATRLPLEPLTVDADGDGLPDELQAVLAQISGTVTWSSEAASRQAEIDRDTARATAATACAEAVALRHGIATANARAEAAEANVLHAIEEAEVARASEAAMRTKVDAAVEERGRLMTKLTEAAEFAQRLVQAEATIALMQDQAALHRATIASLEAAAAARAGSPL